MPTLDEIIYDIQKRHREAHSWREAARPYGIFPSMARMLANGYQPGTRIRTQLGLPPSANVNCIGDPIPDGSQALRASRCACGQYFISNHPRRKRCFICSPYRRSKKE